MKEARSIKKESTKKENKAISRNGIEAIYEGKFQKKVLKLLKAKLCCYLKRQPVKSLFGRYFSKFLGRAMSDIEFKFFLGLC